MNEYKKLLVLKSALDDLEGTGIPFNIIKGQIEPLSEWVNHRIGQLEKGSD